MNINKRLGLLQDVGSIHAEIFGVGYEKMIQDDEFWVITQQKLKMKKWPKWQDCISVRTWPRKVEGIKAYRDFEIFLDGEKIGESVATFMVLNGKTRRPVKPSLDESINDHVPDNVLDMLPGRVNVPEDMEVKNTIVVRNSDLDMNNHVNNTQYGQWVLDTIPLDYHKKFVVDEFEINFLSETHLQDEIDIKSFINEEGKDRVSSFYQGIRKSDNKVVFNCSVTGRGVSN